MLKKVLTVAAVSALSTPAFAGFYVNVENNGSYTGKDYTGSGTDLHLGYENGNAFGSYYIQGGAYAGYRYITSPQFEKMMMDKVMSKVSGMMPKVLDGALPSTTGKSIPFNK